MKERANWILEKPVLSSPQVEAEWIIVGGHPLVYGVRGDTLSTMRFEH